MTGGSGSGALRIGTSGWAYPEWRPAFYPRGTRREDFLASYATRLDACEVNGTFHRVQRPEVTARWADAVGDDFRFAVKVHRGIVGAREDRPELRARFLESIAPLRPRLGALLVQLDPRRRRDDEGLRRMLDVLGGETPAAVELAHESWSDPVVDGIIRDAGATRCLTERDGGVPDALPPGPVGYVRLRADRYEDPARHAWRSLLVREAASRPVLAFARHKDVPPDDPHVGLAFALWLHEGGGA